MSATGALTPDARAGAPPLRLRNGAASVYAGECRKLVAQYSTRVLALVCLVGPIAFTAVLNAQSGTPADSLFGYWVHASGYAVTLVLLTFAGSWGLPLIAGVLAGDIFSSEDRYGTWKTVLTRSCPREDIFAGKVLAAFTFALALTGLTALTTTLAGIIFVGSHPLVGLDGQTLSASQSLTRVLASWLTCVPPVLAFASLALLFSVWTRSGIIGVLAPALIALLSQLVNLIGKGAWAHALLPGSAFDAWHGLFDAHPFYGQLIVSIAVSLIWTTAALAATWVIFAGRDFIGPAVPKRAGWLTPIRAVAATVVVVALLAFASNWGPVGITQARLQRSITPTFANLTLLQQRITTGFVAASPDLHVVPYCTHHANTQQGPGDWTCILHVLLPTAANQSQQQTPISYEVSVSPDGCYKGTASSTLVGAQTITSSAGRSVTNPLFVIYGCFDPL
jgi:ABC-2 type transport system permease protein